MDDEASDTFGSGVNKYTDALAATSALVGAEEVIRRVTSEGSSVWVGVALIVIALPIYLSPTAWRWVRSTRRMGYAKAKQGLSYLHQRDSDLGSSVISMAHPLSPG
jgi:hypothetical protein